MAWSCWPEQRALAPDTVRMMLTGNDDLETAMNAVNEGNVFRFLTKPVNKEVLATAITAGLSQYRLITAEKQLLEKTLSGTIKVLTEVLSLVNPAAFSRATRIRQYIQHLVAKFGLPSPWSFEVAAMMSQLGCVTLDTETINAVYAGRELSPEEQARFDAHPKVAQDLLSKIPRMEPIAWMIAQQLKPAPLANDVTEPATLINRLGAQILRTALAFDQLLATGMDKSEAVSRLLGTNDYDRKIVEALAEVNPKFDRIEARTCRIGELSAGMVLNQEIRTHTGMLVVAKGQEITYLLLTKLRNYWEKQAIANSFPVLIPRTASQEPQSRKLP